MLIHTFEECTILIKRLSCSSRAVAAVTIAACSVAGGCASTDYPASSSLTDLTFESRSHHGPILDHSEIIGLNGLLPVVETGIVVHYADSSVPTTALGVAWNHSFRLEAATPDDAMPSFDEVAAVRNTILRIQDQVTEATRLTLEMDAVRKLLAQTTAGDADATAERAQFVALLQKLRTGREALDRDIRCQTELLRTQSAKRGLIIARWRAQREAGGAGKAGALLAVEATAAKARAGFVILGGIRMNFLFWGDDFKQMIAMLNDSDAKMFRAAGIVSYLLQARHLAYVSDLDLEARLGVKLDLSVESLANPTLAGLSLDRLRISSYLTTLSNLTNQGMLSDITWCRRPFCFASGHGFEELAQGQNWKTVVVQVTKPGRFPGTVLSQYQREVEEGNIPPKASHRGRCKSDWCDEFPSLRGPGAQRPTRIPTGTP